MTEYRAHFDARIEFVHGGSLTAEAFRVDLPADVGPGSSGADEAAVGRLFVQHLGLALVGKVAISNLAIVEEQHRGTRGIEPVRAGVPGRLVDLSHPIGAGPGTYPGLPAPTITPHLTRAESRSHYAPGTDLAGLSLETLVDQRAEVFHLTDASARGIRRPVFYDRDLAGRAVLLHTGWYRHFGTPEYAHGAPFLSEDAAAYLVEQGVTLVGIDSLNIDDTESTGSRPAHSLLLEAGIHVVEHLTALGELPPTGSLFTAVPPRIVDVGTFPIRAFARVL